jgi:signal transduction histidine kinase
VTVRVVLLCALATCFIAFYALGRVPDARGLLWVALGCVAVAGLSGYALGWDIARDLDLLVGHVRALAEGREAADAAFVPVLSADEIGDLQAALARLHDRLGDDVEAQRRALRLTEAADREKSTYLGDVEQAIRRPLLAIRETGAALVEGRHGALAPAQTEDIQIVVKGAEQLLDLLEDVVHFAAAQDAGIELRVEPVDVTALCREVVRAHEPQVTGRAVALRLELPADLPRIHADARRLRQVLNNLVGNALKFTDSGRIAVSADADADTVSIHVSDTGSGIAPADLDRIFEEFGQAGPARSRRRGAGLGLAICRRLVELHGGTLTVASAVGSGSTFTIRFPAVRA